MCVYSCCWEWPTFRLNATVATPTSFTYRARDVLCSAYSTARSKADAVLLLQMAFSPCSKFHVYSTAVDGIAPSYS